MSSIPEWVDELRSPGVTERYQRMVNASYRRGGGEKELTVEVGYDDNHLAYTSSDGTIVYNSNFRLNNGDYEEGFTNAEAFDFFAGIIAAHEVGHQLITDMTSIEVFLKEAYSYWREGATTLREGKIRMLYELPDGTSDDDYWQLFKERHIMLDLVGLIANIFEDGVLERYMLREQPGYAAHCLRRVRRYFWDKAIPLDEVEDAHTDSSVDEALSLLDLPSMDSQNAERELASILNALLLYVKYGKMKVRNVHVSAEDMPVGVQFIRRHREAIDKVMNTADPRLRAKRENGFLVLLKSVLNRIDNGYRNVSEGVGGMSAPSEAKQDSKKDRLDAEERAKGVIDAILKEKAEDEEEKKHGETRTKRPDEASDEGDEDASDNGSGDATDDESEDVAQASEPDESDEAPSKEDAETDGNASDERTSAGVGSGQKGRSEKIEIIEDGRSGRKKLKADAPEDDLMDDYEDDSASTDAYSGMSDDEFAKIIKGPKSTSPKEALEEERFKAEREILTAAITSDERAAGGALASIKYKVVEIPHIRSMDPAYAVYESRVKNTAKRLADAIKRKLERLNKSVQKKKYYARKVHAPHMYRRDGDCFKDKKPSFKKRDVVVGILFDQSGSMSYGDRIDVCKEIGATLIEFCNALDIPVMAYGHNTDDKEMFMFRYFEPHEAKREKAKIMAISAHGANNHDGAALEYMYRRLAMRAEQKKILFIISDGAPAACNYFGPEANADVANRVKSHREVVTVAAGIGSDVDALVGIYGKERYLNVSDDRKLPQKLLAILSKFYR